MSADSVMAIVRLLVGLQMLVRELLAADIAGVVQHLSRQLNVVVGELADLRIVNAEDFGFLGCAQREPGDEVHDEEDETGAAEGVYHSADGIRELVAELDPVVVEPSAGDLGEAI